MRAFFVLACVTVVSLPTVASAQDLAPPPPMDPNAPNGPPATGTAPSSPEAQQSATLENDERKDSGRGLELIWLNAEAGASYINMTQFNSTTFALEKSSSGGPMFGVGAGIRLVVFTIGVRARIHELSVFNLWQVNGEFGFHIPLGDLDPYINLHGGYAFVGRLGSESLSATTSSSSNDVSIHGFNAGLSLGGDYYVSPMLSLGLDLTADLLFLKRPPTALPAGFDMLPPAQQMQIQSDPLYKDSGDSAGFGFSGSAHLGLHF